jgi:ATP-binding protein involved in chromosome partitioning
VASICKGSDDGQPVVRMNDISGMAFKKLATRVVDAIDRRNSNLPPTEVVQTH